MIIYDNEFVRFNFNSMPVYDILKILSIPNVVDVVSKSNDLKTWIHDYIMTVGDIWTSIGCMDKDYEVNDNTIVFILTNPDVEGIDKMVYCCVTRNIVDKDNLIDQMIGVSKMKAFI